MRRCVCDPEILWMSRALAQWGLLCKKKKFELTETCKTENKLNNKVHIVGYFPVITAII